MKLKYTPLLLLLLGTACHKKTEDTPIPTLMLRPVARFSVPALIESGVSFQVTNQSTDATSFVWTWGDGTSSTGDTPTHSYTRTGRTRIRLTATSSSGSDTTSQVVNVTVQGAAPAGVLSSAVGQYRGRLRRTRYDLVSGAVTSVTFRDTTLSVTTSNATSLTILGYNLTYSSVGTSWEGHAPLRSNFMFFDIRSMVQLESPGDSIYLRTYFAGLGRTSGQWQFYGKKQP